MASKEQAAVSEAKTVVTSDEQFQLLVGGVEDYAIFLLDPEGHVLTWNAGAEPAQYGHTGKLSFFMDATGVRSGDIGGKPLTPANIKN